MNRGGKTATNEHESDFLPATERGQATDQQQRERAGFGDNLYDARGV